VSYRLVEIPGRQFVTGLFIPREKVAPAAAA
jgi:hypothetical protein